MKQNATQANKTLAQHNIVAIKLAGEDAKGFNGNPAKRKQLAQKALELYDHAHTRDIEANQVKHAFGEWIFACMVKWHVEIS